MSVPRYTRPAMALHWLQAALVLALLGIGYWMGTLPKGPDFSTAVALHKSLGLCGLVLIALRLAWRAGHRPPATPDSLPRWQQIAAEHTHRLLYALLVLAPVCGYLSASFTKYPMKFFGVVLPKPWEPDDSLNAVFNLAHKSVVILLTAMVALHIGAALFHALRRDGILSRMLPGKRQS
ncbi:MAG: cytochrome b [Rhodocyclaceae bacterium]|nr:MAG: cytochrome b [Rhodocyclaceae bacterium]